LECLPADALAPGGDKALGEIALAPTVVRGVDREAERGIAAGHRPVDVVLDKGIVAADIELKNTQGVGRCSRDLLETGVADRA